MSCCSRSFLLALNQESQREASVVNEAPRLTAIVGPTPQPDSSSIRNTTWLRNVPSGGLAAENTGKQRTDGWSETSSRLPRDDGHGNLPSRSQSDQTETLDFLICQVSKRRRRLSSAGQKQEISFRLRQLHSVPSPPRCSSIGVSVRTLTLPLSHRRITARAEPASLLKFASVFTMKVPPIGLCKLHRSGCVVTAFSFFFFFFHCKKGKLAGRGSTAEVIRFPFSITGASG